MQPFTTFRATIKRLVPGEPDSARVKAFRAAFPGFQELLGKAPQSAELASAVLHERRRYSGALFAVGPPLGRARYGSVCVDGSGEDGGGLGQELRAYASFATCSKLVIHDLGRAESEPRLSSSGWSTGNRLGLHFDDPDSALFERYSALGTGTRVGRGAWRTHLDYSLEEVCIEDSVDLRLPDTQEWFFETFRTGFEPFWRKREDPSVRRFHDMLPTLMTAELGGNAATDAVGRVLRSLGARALVYPSARSNPDAIVHQGQLLTSVGFNLVEFGGTPILGDDEQQMVFDDPEPWSVSVFWPRLRCEVAELGKTPELPRPFHGSWRLRGVREAHERFWLYGGHLGAEQEDWENTVVRARVGIARTLERSRWEAAGEPRAVDPVDNGRVRPSGEREYAPGATPGDGGIR